MAEVEAELAREHTMCNSLRCEMEATKTELDEVRKARTQSENENAQLRESVAQLRDDVANRSRELETADLKVCPRTGLLVSR